MNFSSVNIFGLQQTAQKHVSQNMNGLTQTMMRLATGKKINSAKDDPAGLIATELIKSESAGIRAQLKTTRERGNKLSVTDSYLSNITNILNDIKGAIIEGANSGALSSDQMDALQTQIDYAVDAVERILKSANYKGEKLLDDMLSSGLSFNIDGSQTLPDEAQSLQFNIGEIDPSQILSDENLTNLRFQLNETTADTSGFFQGISQILGSIVYSVGGEEGAAMLRISAQSLQMAEAAEEGISEEGSVEEGSAEAASEAVTEVTEGETVEELLAEDAETEATAGMGIETKENVETEAAEVDEAAVLAGETEEVTEAAAIASETASIETNAAEEEDKTQATEEKTEKEKKAEGEVLHQGSGYVFKMNTETVDPGAVEEEKPEAVVFDTEMLMQTMATGMMATNYVESGVDMMALQNLAEAACTENEGEDEEEEVDETEEEEETACPGNNVEKEKEKNTETAKDEDDKDPERVFDIVSLRELKKGGSASLKNDPAAASKIIDSALSAVVLERARLGAEMKYGVDVDMTLLQNQLIQNAEAEAMYSDADYITEASNLARYQLLLQSSLQVLKVTQELPKMLMQFLDMGYSSMKTDAKTA